MKFLELVNKCLLELNYKQVNTFSELVKNDHKRIMNILNIINNEICNIEGWNFLLRKTKITLSAGSSEVKNTIDGRILYLFIDGNKYEFTEEIEQFLNGKGKSGCYSEFADNLLLPAFDEDKTLDIVYYTRNCALNNENKEIKEMKNANDMSLIPEPFVEPILVYGTCLRLKGNPQYYRFSYWMSMYKEALANLKSKTSVYVLNSPQISLFRR